jgi:hypothetical protein
VFTSIADALYADQDLLLTPAQATQITDAVTALFAILQNDSQAFETFLLKSLSKDNKSAPRSTGF